MEDTVHLNVGGVRHEIRWTTLQKHPETRLAKIRDMSKEKKVTTLDPLYYDRNPTIFTSILISTELESFVSMTMFALTQ